MLPPQLDVGHPTPSISQKAYPTKVLERGTEIVLVHLQTLWENGDRRRSGGGRRVHARAVHREGMMRSHTSRSFLLFALGILALPGALAAQQLSLHVNLPAYRLDVYRGEERVRSYTVGIDAPSFPTPMGAFELEYVEWNPWWNPPASPWARGEKRTPPGPGNPMGRAKVGFLPLFYFHGSSSGFGRASSHGCIRMRNEDVLDLARLLALESGAAIGAEDIRALERNPSRTRRIPLPSAIPVRIVYRLAEEIDGRVHVHEDVYGMGMTSREREMAGRAGREGG
jgi:hypothetical protein